jgi:hypothetical protein
MLPEKKPEIAPAPRPYPPPGPHPTPSPEAGRVIPGQELGAHPPGASEAFKPDAPEDDIGDRIYARGEFLWWRFRNDRVPPLITTSPPSLNGTLQPGTTVLLSGSALNVDDHFGGRFTGGFWLDECYTVGVEGNFFFLPRVDKTFTASSGQFPGMVIARPFLDLNTMMESAQIATSPVLATGSVSAHQFSQLWGAEADLRCNLCCECAYRVDLLAGFRYVDLKEGLNITEDLFALPGGSAFGGDHILVNDRFNTRNQFYGGQLGVVGEYHYGAWFVEGRGKLALGANHETVDIFGFQTVTTPTGTMIPPDKPGGLLALSSNIGHHTRTRFSVIPELGVNLGYQFSDHIRVFAGYNLLYWTNVVRPGEQIDRGLDVNRIPRFPPEPPIVGVRPAVLFKETEFWAQGVNFGMEVRF